MTASLATLTRAINASRPNRTGIAPDEHAALIRDLAPALVEAVNDSLVDVFVDAADDHTDLWGVLVCVDFVDAREFGPVVLRYCVPEWQRETCRKAHGGFDERMAGVEWAEGAFDATAFHLPKDVQDAIFNHVHDEVVQVAQETLRSRTDYEVRERKEAKIIERWSTNGGYLVGVSTQRTEEPRIYHDEKGDSLSPDERSEGDKAEGIVGGSAQRALDEYYRAKQKASAQDDGGMA